MHLAFQINNIAIGIPVVVLCLITSLVAFTFYRKEKYSLALIFVLLTGFILRVYVSSDQHLFTWDERYHSLVAKNLVKHPLKPTLYDTPVFPYQFSNWMENHVWLEKGPVPLWSMAASISILGNTELAARLPSLIISLMAIYLSFLIGTYLFNKKIGLLAAFFHAINGMLIEMAGGRISSDHVETFFIFFIELGVLLSIITIVKNKGFLFSILIGVAIGLAILSKWLPAILVFPLWVTGEWFVKNKSKPQIFFYLGVSIFACCATAFPWLWYIHIKYPIESEWIFKKFIFAYDQTVDQHKGTIWFYFQNVGMVFGEVIWIPLVISVYQIIKKQVNWKMILLTMWWMIPFVIFSFAATKRYTYLLLSAPALFVILSYYCFYLYEHKFKLKWLKPVLILVLVGLPIRYSIERTKPFTKRDRIPQWAVDLKQMKNKYKSNTIFFNEPHAIEGMYYTDYIFYTRVPTHEEMVDLKLKGYQVIIR